MAWTLPNILTVGRIVATPFIAILAFLPGWFPKTVAVVLFIVAAVSDVIDGYLARSRGEISDLGKLLDPIADKVLLIALLVPIYWLTHTVVRYELPWWGAVPLWAVLLLVVREIFITAFRWMAKRRGVVLAAGGAGKLKAIFQDIFLGAAISWFAWKDMLLEFGWTGWFQRAFDWVLGTAGAVSLAVSVILTAYSLVVYLYRERALLKSMAGS